MLTEEYMTKADNIKAEYMQFIYEKHFNKKINTVLLSSQLPWLQSHKYHSVTWLHEYCRIGNPITVFLCQ